MKKLHLEFSSSILRRIGEELNPSPSHGLLELVKNAYDADALSCTIDIQQADMAQERLGKIIVEDNGDGMTIDNIQNGWLLIGKSSKEAKSPTRRTCAINLGSPNGTSKIVFIAYTLILEIIIKTIIIKTLNRYSY